MARSSRYSSIVLYCSIEPFGMLVEGNVELGGEVVTYLFFTVALSLSWAGKVFDTINEGSLGRCPLFFKR